MSSPQGRSDDGAGRRQVDLEAVLADARNSPRFSEGSDTRVMRRVTSLSDTDRLERPVCDRTSDRLFCDTKLRFRRQSLLVREADAGSTQGLRSSIKVSQLNLD